MLSNQLPPSHYNEVYKSRNVNRETNGNRVMMRGPSHGGNHHQNGGLQKQNGGLADRKPSKLEQIRADYQRKLMKEKEEKMVQVYEDNQKKAMMRMARNGSGGPHNGALSPSGGKSVRDFFNERRKMEANGMSVPPIDNHYRQAKGYSSPGGWSSRTGSGTSVNMRKISAGRDRSQPLAPIRRPLDTQEVVNNNVNFRSGIPQRQHHQPINGYEENPFQGRPRLVKHKPLPPTNGQHIDDNNNDGNWESKPPPQPSQPSQLPKYVPQSRRPGQQLQMQHVQQQQQQKQQPPQQQSYKQPQPPQYQRHQPGRSPVKTRYGVQTNKPEAEGNEKLTDFKKWQMDQNKARETRLKKINSQRNIETFDDDGVWAKPEDDPRFPEENIEDDDENGEEEEEEDNSVSNTGRTEDSEIQRKERELMEKIAKQQGELEKMRVAREREEEESTLIDEETERLEMERRKKREAIERQRQKKIDEEMRKEEERQRRQDEEEERMERQKEEKIRKEDEKRRKENDRRKKEEDRRRREEEKLMMKREKEEEKRQQQQQQQQQLSFRSENYNESPGGFDEDSPLPSSRQTAAIPSTRDSKQSRSQMNDDDLEERPVAQSDANYYAKAASSSDAKGSVGSLVRCKVCGRSFASDRLQKHQAACSKANKPRKEFDASKKRVEGTELAKYAAKAKKREPPKKKSNWRAKHEEFIQALRYAKKVTEVEKGGGDIRSLPPPPPSHNPDLVECPHCARTFNETAAERHIPRCQQLKTRPPPMNTRKR